MATVTMSSLAKAEEETIKNAHPLDEVEQQQLMITIREFQKSLKPIISFSEALRSLSKLVDIYKDNFAPIAKKLVENPYAANVIGAYVNTENAKAFEGSLENLRKDIANLRNYTDFDDGITSAEAICIKPVEIKIKEKILPKFTTLEYN